MNLRVNLRVTLHVSLPSRFRTVFVVFDLETTGLDPESNEIIEIGAIRVDSAAGSREYFQSLVLPRIPSQRRSRP